MGAMYDLQNSPLSPINQDEDIRLDDCPACGSHFTQSEYEWQSCYHCGHTVDTSYENEEY